MASRELSIMRTWPAYWASNMASQLVMGSSTMVVL